MPHEGMQLCKAYGIPVIESSLARSPEEAVRIADQMGYPVVLKVVSRDILHKTDVGGVILNVSNGQEVRSAYERLIANVSRSRPEARIDGVLVSKMARPGVELLMGVNRDKTFGHVILFGMGGILTELLEDVSIRISPIDKAEAIEMINEIRGRKLLEGFRGGEKVNKEVLAETLVSLGRMVEENKEISSIDLNPVMGYADGAIAVDVKIVVSSGELP